MGIMESTLNDRRAKPVPSDWVTFLSAYEDWLRAGGRPVTTIKTRLDHGRRLARGLGVPVAEVTTAILLAWLGKQRWSLETRRSWQGTVRGMWKAFRAAGLVEDDPTADLPSLKVPKHRPRPVDESVYRAALDRADGRESLALRLGHDYGLRRAEIVVIHEADLWSDLEGMSLLVHGKGNKTRLLPLLDSMARELRTACQVGGGYAFPGKIDGHLSPAHLGRLCAAVLGESTLHPCRHSFATQTLRATGNVMIVKELLGHESLATTQMYMQVAQAELRAALSAVPRPGLW